MRCNNNYFYVYFRNVFRNLGQFSSTAQVYWATFYLKKWLVRARYKVKIKNEWDERIQKDAIDEKILWIQI